MKAESRRYCVNSKREKKGEKESNLNPLKLRIDRVESIGKNNVQNWVTYKNKILSVKKEPYRNNFLFQP